jgi:TrmH family RNA methyltransferase
MTEPPEIPKLRIVLVHPQHPGNIGAAARAMKTMGFSDLVLVAPREFPHPNAEAMAAGAGDVLAAARVCSTLAQAVGDCTRVVATTSRARSLSLPVFEPREWAPRWASGALGRQVALLFGSERVGLTNEVLDSCQETVSIPGDPRYAVLNLGQAVQVLCYELRVTQAPALARPAPDHEPVEQAELERFFAHLEDVLIGLAFLDPDNPRLLMRRLRRLFARAAPDFNEINILRGILTAVEDRIDRPPA